MGLIKVESTELSRVQAMYQRAFKPLYEKYHDRLTNPYLESLSDLRAKYREPNRRFYYYQVDHQTVGFLGLVFDASQQVVRISPLLVLPQFQGQHYAQRMLLSVENAYPEVRQWQVDTIAEETKLVHLYRKLGYKQVAHRCDEVQPRMHLIYFVKEIK
ncbi:GNAT family N-acetyltransferase [Lactiplantibacillus paraxiangfangensis]|uniref:GNAT family N-acetyltransferase n=2 Tax=Lactiplantibacillus paraxiangfangensis TaxID=3076224 RepID=UPI0030C6D781